MIAGRISLPSLHRLWTELHWAERSALVLAGGLAGVAAMVCLTACVAVGSFAYWRFDATLLTWSLGAIAVFTVPFWGILRASDLIARALQQGMRRSRTSLARRGSYPAGIKAQMGWH